MQDSSWLAENLSNPEDWLCSVELFRGGAKWRKEIILHAGNRTSIFQLAESHGTNSAISFSQLNNE
jgi:hypothetical protein